MKINKDWKTIFKRYSFITHLLIAISTVGTLAVPAISGVILISDVALISIVAVLSVMGVVGSFINQQVKEDSCEVKDD